MCSVGILSLYFVNVFICVFILYVYVFDHLCIDLLFISNLLKD